MSSAPRLSLRGRLVLVAGLLAVTCGLALAPRPFSAPIAKVANYRADPPGPIFNVPIDDGALARAGEIVPDDAVYVLIDGAPPSPGDPKTLLHHDLLGASYLHLVPAVPSVRLRDAGWAIAYEQDVPASGVEKRYELGPGIVLVKVATP